jgi:calcineurin-like phosphoesterase family protein
MIFFTSDLHIYHTNVIKYCARPYSSVEEMNEMLVKNWNDVVGPEDTVYCLGDFSMAFRPVETFSPRLNGKKYLVPGNHDFCHSYHKKSRNEENRKKWIKAYEDNGWTVLPEQTTLDIPGIATVNICHHPYYLVATENYDDKYVKWRPKDDGRWLLCGHVHEKWKVVGKMINVGVDQWDFKPVAITEIEKIICASSTTQSKDT